MSLIKHDKARRMNTATPADMLHVSVTNLCFKNPYLVTWKHQLATNSPRGV
jgi:hypothetical protein